MIDVGYLVILIVAFVLGYLAGRDKGN